MSKKSILVVDDSPTTSELIAIQLQNLGYGISAIADSGDSALKKAEQTNPDLVLMDINLGKGMNGIQAANLIMQKYNKPVIYVTSYSDDKTLEQVKQSMPYGFINKPIRDKDLRVNIEIALSRKEFQSDTPEPETDYCNSQSSSLDIQRSPLSEVLDHLVSGVIMVNSNFIIQYKNKSAMNILEGDSPLRLQGKKLEFRNPNTKRTIRQLINDQTSSVFTIKYQKQELHTLIFPMGYPSRSSLENHVVSGIFLFTTNKDSQHIADVVRTIYKLSPTEAKITSMLVFNPQLSDIADSLGITYNTARTHMKRIYQKTDTNKLSALIQKIMTGPAGLLIHSII
jgi:DNA-binding NarL/FixJ family response regulator